MTGVGDGGIPSDYFVSSQLQLWLFCCWGWGCCWAVTIEKNPFFRFSTFLVIERCVKTPSINYLAQYGNFYTHIAIVCKTFLDINNDF